MRNAQLVGRPVTSLQTMLRTIAQVIPAQPTVVPDGVYGDQTMRAVSEFQRQNGMESTGIADLETWQKIVEAFQDARIEVEAAEPLNILLEQQQVILPGSRNRHVYLIQGMLMALSDDYKELEDVRATGIYDDATQKAVQWFQGCCDAKCSGILTKADWRMLTGLYVLKIGNGEREKDLKT